MEGILIDTGFWYALYDTNDQFHDKALSIVDYLSLGKIVLPFPTLYESINTRFSANKSWLNVFRIILNNQNIILLSDADYKLDALQLVLNSKRNLSLVDTVIRLILEDDTINIKYLITFNPEDFHDVCIRKSIQIIDS